jgi:hypothetical protein
MTRSGLLTFALLLGVLPVTASAAPFGEVAFRPAGGTATCLRATGLAGEVVRSTPTGAQFLQAGPGGLTPVADVASEGEAQACPQAAARPNGVGIVAFALRTSLGDDKPFVRVALREPGGTWGPHSDVAALADVASAHPLAAGISERGDALVAVAGVNDAKRFEVVAARRAPGGAFGPAQTLFTAGEGASSQARVLAGVAANGDSIVAWSFQAQANKPRELWAAIAPASGPFAAAVKLGTLRVASSFSLAVGDGGQALLGFATGDDVVVAERAPGGSFGPAARVGTSSDLVLVTVAAAIRADGGAVVAWQNALAGDVQAALRSGPGAFAAPVALAPKSGLRFPKSVLDLYAELVKTETPGSFTSSAAGPDDDGGDARASITPDGRAVVTWAGVAKRNGVWWSPPLVASIPLTGGPPSQAVLGAELREAGATAALTTANGTLGVAWADNGDNERDGRLHLALEGVPDGADPAAPELTVIAPKKRVLAADEPLRFGVRCSAACDVHVQVGSGVLAATEDFSLTRAGERRVSLRPDSDPLASLKGGPVSLRVRYAAPGARRSAGKTVTYRLRRLPDAPRPKVLGAVARRSGSAVVVTWRSDRDAKPSNFAVFGSKTREGAFDYIGDGDVKGSGRHFRVRLRDAREARYVRVIARADGARKFETTTVRVRG